MHDDKFHILNIHASSSYIKAQEKLVHLDKYSQFGKYIEVYLHIIILTTPFAPEASFFTQKIYIRTIYAHMDCYVTVILILQNPRISNCTHSYIQLPNISTGNYFTVTCIPNF